MDAGTSKSESKMKISFGVKRAPAVKLQQCAPDIINVVIDSDEEREHEEEANSNKKRKLTHFEDGAVPDDDVNKKKSTVVIPMVQEPDWRVAKLLVLREEGKLTEEDEARLAILTESQPFQASKSYSNTEAVIVDDERKVVEDADYNAIVPLRILPRRPNGLGLGATPPHPEQRKAAKDGKSDDNVDEIIKKDSLIRMTAGRYKGLYGKVESRDDDNNSLFVRLAVGGQQVKVSMFAVQVVSKKEFDRDSKCINKDDYDKERDKIDKRVCGDSENGATYKKGGLKSDAESKEKQKRANDKYCGDLKADRNFSNNELWVRADLLVRFIDENYKKGKYFKEKMRVVDVASRKDICLEDSRGKMHYGIRQSWLETVLPRIEKSRVMIVRGKYKGCSALIEEKNKRDCTVVIRLLSSNEIITVDFDDVCQHQPKEDDDDEY
ncbi:hypothetical protein DICVIV_09484 [Dictyocaulus viviparus]|uniref:KOW domain-containing protein n=1 Tax=Dictyocaulus viviparus TaxID=29172 RepID=A0A0D8XQ21_DICVI|nr:hypothetical protein DICVIV_09484 [Dictyocaulus viviparus]